jgi:ribosomal protein S6
MGTDIMLLFSEKLTQKQVTKELRKLANEMSKAENNQAVEIEGNTIGKTQMMYRIKGIKSVASTSTNGDD